MKILVTGATGWVGLTLCQKLIEAGHTVYAVTRSTSSAKNKFAFIHHWIEWADYHQNFPNSDIKLDAVIHLMGEPIAQRWSLDAQERIYDSRVVSTTKIAEFVQKQNIPVFVSASAIGFYGDGGDNWLDEDSAAGTDFLSTVCQKWERKALKAEPSARTTILRFGVVLGKSGGSLKKMELPYKLGLGGPLGSGNQWLSWIHIDDLHNIIMQALVNKQFHGIYNTVAPTPVRQKDFSGLLAKTLHRPHFLFVPQTALKLAFGEMSSVLLSSCRASPKKLIALGYDFLFSTLDTALKDIYS